MTLNFQYLASCSKVLGILCVSHHIQLEQDFWVGNTVLFAHRREYTSFGALCLGRDMLPRYQITWHPLEGSESLEAWDIMPSVVRALQGFQVD